MRLNRLLLASVVFVFVSGVAVAQDSVLARFRVPAQTALDVYYPGGLGDELTTVTNFQRSWDPVGPTGGWLTNQFNAPDIATPSLEGPEGGNALFGNSDNSATTRQGYWLQLNTPISGSFTAEVFFNLTVLDPLFAEHKMQNLISTFWMSDNKAFELRYFGPSTDLGAGVADRIQVMTSDGTTEHDILSNAGVITANKWYYAAVVFDNAANQISFYLADASGPTITPALVGAASPGWGAFTMEWLCLAAWPNPAGSCRDITGYIDAFGLTKQALAPGNLLLLNLPALPPASVSAWQLYD